MERERNPGDATPTRDASAGSGADLDSASLHPGYAAADARAKRGYVCYALGRDAEARLGLDEALGANPELLVAHINLGLVEARLGNHEAAIGHYQKVPEADQRQYLTRYNLALAYQRAGRDEDACAEPRRVVADAKRQASRRKPSTRS